MSKKRVFCTNCREEVDYKVINEMKTSILRGEEYTYIGERAECLQCHSEIYIPEVNDTNLKNLYAEFREKNDLISLENIMQIPTKYNIGKRPLSLLLGWGEVTFTRFYDGDIPSKQYSDVLKKIFEDPNYYEELLEKNKSNLKSTNTYEKSKNAVLQCKLQTTDNNSKINIIISSILNDCKDITPLALQKALYYIQGFYFAFYSKFLFAEDCEAWVHGPVYREVYNRYRGYRYESINVENVTDKDKLSSSEIEILDSVVKNICCYSGKILEDFTHSETPWIKTREGLLDNEPSDRIINKNDIGKYFKDVKEKYNMINPRDIKQYSQSMFSRE